jgi:Ni/Co efflux regulator RcnB
MKLFLTSVLTLSLIGGSAALAQPGGRHGQTNDRQANDRQAAASRQWSRGERLPSNYRTADRYVDYRANHLSRPSRGRRWVRTDDGRYAEIAVASGLIYAIANAR